MKYPRIYEKWPESETPDLFRLLENLNVMGLAEDKLNLPPENRVVHNPAEQLFSSMPNQAPVQPNLPVQTPVQPNEPENQQPKNLSNLVM